MCIRDSYKRIRLGIGHPGQKDLVSKYVLENFSKKEQQWLKKLLNKIAVEAAHLANEASEKFINQISLSPENEKRKDKQIKELKVVTPSETTNLQIDAGEMQKSTLQKLIDKFSRK